MPSLLEVMTGIETRLKTIPDLRVAAYEADQINPPQAIVGVPPIPEYRRSFSPTGLSQIEPTVTILVSAALDRVGQMKLASYADKTGDQSVFAAIEADPTLGGLSITCSVKSFLPLSQKGVGLIGYYGGVFTLACLATG